MNRLPITICRHGPYNIRNFRRKRLGGMRILLYCRGDNLLLVVTVLQAHCDDNEGGRINAMHRPRIAHLDQYRHEHSTILAAQASCASETFTAVAVVKLYIGEASL